MNQQAETGGIKVLMKTMSILNLLADEQGAELPLNKIATRLQLNKSTCHHILDTLAAGDYVEKSAPGQYKLGVGLFRVGSRLLDQLDVRERAKAPMAEAQRLTGETVFLYIRRGDEGVCIDRLDGQYSSSHMLRIGGALPFHAGASPKVFLATQSDQEIEAYLDRAQANHSMKYPLDTRRVWRDVDEFRRTGSITSAGDIEVNTLAMGAAVYDHSGSVAGAISISWVDALSANSEEDIREHLIDAARRISFALGHASSTTGSPR